MTIGEKLRFFAENYIGSVAKLAELLDMKPPSLYVYLNNESIPGGDILRKLKDLGCDINWLLSDTPDPPPETIQTLLTRLKELEEENQRLRDSISRFLLLAQEVEQQKKSKRKPKK
ncbi:helix-turn-helix domain-containing protein [Rosettibacter firmus]|uniref:helix-turn-helix domain-containing protein n=1 Tax=Rosettibacter firmus TaxID=3111522 RepID=UPI00336BBC24